MLKNDGRKQNYLNLIFNGFSVKENDILENERVKQTSVRGSIASSRWVKKLENNIQLL